MLSEQTATLRACIEEYADTSAVSGPSPDALQQAIAQDDRSALLALYHDLYPRLEQALWKGPAFDRTLAQYQALFREQEALRQAAGDDTRHRFILSIPVADRPPHVERCLESIHQQCLAYGYGGSDNGVFTHVQVVIAEDSQHVENIEQHIALAEEYTNKGLRVHHFGLEEQYDLLQGIPRDLRKKLESLLTDQPRERFYRKGQAANRNLSYLKCQQLSEDPHRTLYYMVDSDQSFQVNRGTDHGNTPVNALNYFYYIDDIFSHTTTTLLTGKLVGDPPVSPSVMVVNFMDDVIACLEQLAALDPQQACRFHHQSIASGHDVSYHDMAGLFGFEQAPQAHPYPCPLSGPHDHLACLLTFAEKLNGFFYGEHLTRQTGFHYGAGFTELSPARTIYPGNYIANHDGLKYIIPFGNLRLRMSGPTAGRLIQAEIGARFVSVNLPMLHTRHIHDDGDGQFRPGVEGGNETIDLADEFERQFFGDLMLFSVARLTRHGDAGQGFSQASVTQALEETEQELMALYTAKHREVQDRNARLKLLVNDGQHWWQQDARASAAVPAMQQFIRNIDLNFGEQSTAYRQIQDSAHRDRRKQQIASAILAYRASRDAWDQLFSTSPT